MSTGALSFRTLDTNALIVLGDKLGSGTYGEVYRTENGEALKIVRPGKYGVGSVRELDILTRSIHPNVMAARVCAIRAEVVPRDSPYKIHNIYVGLVMPLASGSLWAAFHHKYETKLRYLRDVLAGLVFIHGLRMVHCDIKPDNCLILCGRQVAISDFGSIYRMDSPPPVLKRPATSPKYRGPEMHGDVPVFAEAGDIWSWGVTVVTFLCGRKALFSGERGMRRDMRDLKKDPHHKLRSIFRSVPSDIRLPREKRRALVALLVPVFSSDPSKRPRADQLIANPLFGGNLFQGIILGEDKGEENVAARETIERMGKKLRIWEGCVALAVRLSRRVLRTSYTPELIGGVCLWIAQKAWGNAPMRGEAIAEAIPESIETVMLAECHILTACLGGRIF